MCGGQAIACECAQESEDDDVTEYRSHEEMLKLGNEGTCMYCGFDSRTSPHDGWNRGDHFASCVIVNYEPKYRPYCQIHRETGCKVRTNRCPYRRTEIQRPCLKEYKGWRCTLPLHAYGPCGLVPRWWNIRAILQIRRRR